MSVRSEMEELFMFQLRAAKHPVPVREHIFARPRLWRFDFAWPKRLIAFEVEGGTWSKKITGHTSGAGYARNCEKYNEATKRGWAVYRVTSDMVKKGEALQLAESVLVSGDL